MKLNWIGYQYRDSDGYGRFGSRLARALMRAGVDMMPLLNEHSTMPDWMQEWYGLDWSRLSISCLPPYYLHRIPGRHWLLSMTEGSILPPGWAEMIQAALVERLIVPCPHNAEAFAEALSAIGCGIPIHVIPGGTDPEEFPILDFRFAILDSSPDGNEQSKIQNLKSKIDHPYTFLALADRGARKGWVEVYAAFYKAFGRPQDTPDVRLLIKARPYTNEMLDIIARAGNLDPRLIIWQEDVAEMRQVYAACDCFVIPSRSEGWGMPMREAAMMGIPTIVQRCSGCDDGYTQEWAYVVEGGVYEPIPSAFEAIAGDWLRADSNAVAAAMRYCYDNRCEAVEFGRRAASWLRQNQTWDHSARTLLHLFESISDEYP